MEMVRGVLHCARCYFSFDAFPCAFVCLCVCVLAVMPVSVAQVSHDVVDVVAVLVVSGVGRLDEAGS
jgi:hypothetical protein